MADIENNNEVFECNQHGFKTDSQKGWNVHLAKMHKQGSSDVTAKEDEIDIDKIAKAVKVSGLINLGFSLLAAHYKNESFKLTEIECSLIDGAIGDILTALPKKTVQKMVKWLPFLPILFVIAPIIAKRIALIVDEMSKKDKGQDDGNNTESGNTDSTSANTA